jgi:hypothetical protein
MARPATAASIVCETVNVVNPSAMNAPPEGGATLT